MRTLAVTYRPKTFDDVVEQGPIVDILKKQIETKTHKNVYLLTGGAGTGKTTSARILANEINGGGGTPIEIDGASRNGVDDVREIIENAKTKAIDAEYKVFIIDECHMLSTGAWNAMLKLIEEPPLKTIIILCTTDPQKIPNTIMSRVFRFNFKRISQDGVVSRLENILKWEHERIYAVDAITDELNFEEYYGTEYMQVLEYIAKVADGGMRDAITMLDKVVSHDHNLTMDKATETLALGDYSRMVDLVKGIMEYEIEDVLSVIQEVHYDGVDLKQFIKETTFFMLDVMKYHIYDSFDNLRVPSTYFKEVSGLCKQFEYKDFAEILPEFIELQNTIKWEQAPKQTIEVFLMAMLGS